MNHLLCSLGTSEAVVIEAVCLLTDGFTNTDGLSVSIVTSDSEATTRAIVQLNTFIQAHQKISFSITRVLDFADLVAKDEQELFDEALNRLYLRLHSQLNKDEKLAVCLAGGFKTMSASLQESAGWFGADNLFHVLAQRPEPKDEAKVRQVYAGGGLVKIDLYAPSGWRQLRALRAEDYPLDDGPDPKTNIACVRLVKIPPSSGRLLAKIREIVANAQALAINIADLAVLPFPELAAWADDDRYWLNKPLNPQTDRDWVNLLPKIDLHLHLGGFATHDDLLRQVQEASREPKEFVHAPDYPPGWPRPEKQMGLENYRKLGDATGSALLNDAGCLRKHCELLFRHMAEENIIYAEIRCSPAKYTNPRQAKIATPWAVLGCIRDCFLRQMQQNSDGPLINIIIIGTREPDNSGRDFRADIARHLALAVTAADQWRDENQPRVVGVDLAGYENSDIRAGLFQEEFSGIHRCGLAITVHAGENDDAEGIWQAVFSLNARRIGHALSLIQAQDLLRSIAARRVAVEMCPYSNYQIKGFKPMAGKPEYPLKKYLEEGVAVTINTDNPGISKASISDNILFAADMNPNLTRLDVLQCLRNAVDAAFASHGQRRKILARMRIPRPSK